MKQIQGIGSQAKQQFTIPLTDGTRVSAYLEYRPQQTGWFLNLVWQDWTLNGLRITASPNILRQWQNVIPFGIAVITSGNVEPLNSYDFSTATAIMVLLEGDDVTLVNQTAFPGN